jgi:hypothetical protein
MVDGEKDPRNLMLLFSLEKVILLEFDVKDHVEVSIWAHPLTLARAKRSGSIRRDILLFPNFLPSTP